MNKVILFVSFLLIIWFFIPIYEKPRVLKNVLSEDQFKLFRKLKARQGKRKRIAYSRNKRGRKGLSRGRN